MKKNVQGNIFCEVSKYFFSSVTVRNTTATEQLIKDLVIIFHWTPLLTEPGVA